MFTLVRMSISKDQLFKKNSQLLLFKSFTLNSGSVSMTFGSYSVGPFKSANSNNFEPDGKESVHKSARKPHFLSISTSLNVPVLPLVDGANSLYFTGRSVY